MISDDDIRRIHDKIDNLAEKIGRLGGELLAHDSECKVQRVRDAEWRQSMRLRINGITAAIIVAALAVITGALLG